MALTDDVGTTMLVSPTGNTGGFGGGDWSWIIVLFLFGLFGGWGGNGGYGGNYDFPWLLNGQNGINNNTNDGFRAAQLQDSITSVRDGISGLSTQLCGCCGDMQMSLANGFAGTNAAITAAQNGLAQQMYSNELANLNRSFAEQTANTAGFTNVANGIADLRYSVATEACADRAAINDALKDVISANTASTQRILDQLCQDKIDAKNDTIAQLRQELIFARGQASQDVQTATIQAGQRALANEVEQYVLPTPKPAYVVANPNCCTTACGCGM